MDNKTKSNIKTQTKTKTKKRKGPQYFLPHSRLNKGQRKYCHCIMKSRMDYLNKHFENKSKKKKPKNRKIIIKEETIKKKNNKLNKTKKRKIKLLNGMDISRSHYFKCERIAKNNEIKFKPKKKKYNQFGFNKYKTNCVSNYNYDSYTLPEIQAFCLEKKISITYPKIIKKNGKKKRTQQYYTKNNLVGKLISHYVKKHIK